MGAMECPGFVIYCSDTNYQVMSNKTLVLVLNSHVVYVKSLYSPTKEELDKLATRRQHAILKIFKQYHFSEEETISNYLSKHD